MTSDGKIGIGHTSPVSILELRDDTPTLTISDTGNNYNDGDVQAVVHLSGRWYSGESNPNADNYSDARMVLRKNYSDGTGGSSLAFETSASGSGGLTEAIRIDKSQNVGIGPQSNGTLNNILQVSSGVDGDGIILTGQGDNTGIGNGSYRKIGFRYDDTDESFESEIRFVVTNSACDRDWETNAVSINT